MDLISLPPEVASELAPSEKVLWHGQPRRGLVLRAADILMIPFSLAWAGFAVFWEASVVTAGAPLVFPLFGAFFVLAGSYIVFGRFIFEAWLRGRTHYAVTSERVLIVWDILSRTVKGIDYRALDEMALSERKDGTGTIVFGNSARPAWLFWGLPSWPGYGSRVGSRFDVIPDVRSVYDTIRAAKRALPA
jgi:hypothetical protein